MKLNCELKITYLHFISGDVERVEQQIENGIDVNIADKYHVTALHVAIRSGERYWSLNRKSLFVHINLILQL